MNGELMNFNKYIGIDPHIVETTSARHCAKGVLIKKNKILLLESIRGDYTFPGGGIEVGESHCQSLKREIIEETGRKCTWIGESIGKITLRRKDIYDDSKMYELISYYYPIKATEILYDLKRSVNEKRLNLSPRWLDIDEAIRKNKSCLKSEESVDFWIDQELYVLNFLRKEKRSL